MSKKSIIVTSGGKNIAPAPLENALLGSQYIEQVLVLGDKRNFLSCLIVPNFDNPAVEYDDVRISACLEHMRKLALIHTADWKSLGFAEIFSVPPNAASCATHTVERLVGELRNFQVEPLPVVTEALEWLRENAPEDSPCISLLKGTNGIGEEIWQNNENRKLQHDSWFRTFVLAAHSFPRLLLQD